MTDERTKPEFDAPSGPAPQELVTRDIVPLRARVAQPAAASAPEAGA